MRIVVDTNVIVSGIFFGGKPRTLLEKCFSGKFQIICTEEIFSEYLLTINGLAGNSRQNIIIEVKSILIENLNFITNRYFEKYSRDPDDDKFINCAKSGNVKYVISGDKDLLILKNVEDIQIIEVSYFLEK